MGLKENLEQRREELYKRFVSVDALVEVLAEVENIDPAEVATALLIAFEQQDALVDKPAFGSVDTVRIKFGQHEFYDYDSHHEILEEALLTIAKGGENEGIDRFGWMLDDLLPFLRANGFERPVYFPPWLSKQTDHSHDVPTEIDHRMQIAFNDNSYSTPLLKLQKTAIDEFYSRRRAVDPTKDEVVEWLTSKERKLDFTVSANVAEAMFTIIKPKDHDPRKRRG